MREYNNKSVWQQVRGKKRAHWGILNLDDLDKNNAEHSRMITKLQAQYQAAREVTARKAGDNKPGQKSEDFSV